MITAPVPVRGASLSSLSVAAPQHRPVTPTNTPPPLLPIIDSADPDYERVLEAARQGGCCVCGSMETRGRMYCRACYQQLNNNKSKR
jgi:hypothetical protein